MFEQFPTHLRLTQAGTRTQKQFVIEQWAFALNFGKQTKAIEVALHWSSSRLKNDLDQ